MPTEANSRPIEGGMMGATMVAGCWMLETGCWKLDAGGWKVEARREILNG